MYVFFFAFLSDNNDGDDSCCHDDQGSTLHLWTVNGRPVKSAMCDHVINCVDFSRAPEGVSVNLIATGLSNGAIRYEKISKPEVLLGGGRGYCRGS